MADKEHKLTIVRTSLAALSSNPLAQIEVARRINMEAHEVFEVERLLTELNTKLFNDKGKVLLAYNRTSITPVATQAESVEQPSRFTRLFTLNYQVGHSIQGRELYVRQEDMPHLVYKPEIKGVGIKVFQVVNIEEETLTLRISGKVYFNIKRGSTGRWGDTPTALGSQDQGKILTFSLNAVPPVGELKISFWDNITQILRGLSDGNFIPPFNTEKSQEVNDA